MQMKKIFVKEKFDLIQYSTPNASLYAALAGKLAGIPVRLYCQWGMVYVGFEGIKRQVFKAIEKIVCKLSTWIEPDSVSNLNFAHEENLYPQTKGSVIWNGSACGINLEKFDISQKIKYRKDIREKYNFPEDSFVYDFVGRITKDKGINELLAAFKQIYESNSNVYLMMVGTTEKDDTVDESLFLWSKKCEHVIYTGFTDIVEQYLSAMDTYILPSYREGFGMGVVEAEAMGVPVIVTSIPGPVDAMKENETGIVVKKGSIKELLRAMKKLYEDKHIRKEYSSNAYDFAINNFEQKKLFGKILLDRKRLLGE